MENIPKIQVTYLSKTLKEIRIQFSVHNPVHVKLGLSKSPTSTGDQYGKGKTKDNCWTNLAWKDETWKYKEEFIDFQKPI